MHLSAVFATIITVFACLGPARAEVLETTKLAPGVFAIKGPFGQRSPENLGNNATFGLVVTKDGAVLIDAGGSHKGAAMIDRAIAKVTDKPVRYVINTGGQDHRWLGNSYWKAKGATIIASAAAVEDQKARASVQQTVLKALIGDGLDGTEPVHATAKFDEKLKLNIGGIVIELHHAAHAHTPGDAFVWVPSARTVFTGDIVYVGRILGIREFSSSAGWLEAFDAMAALKPRHLVPGHSPATDLATARRDTRDYIANLRRLMAAHIDNGGDIIGSVKVDQSAFTYLIDFKQLAGSNAQQVFSEMEWE